MTLPDKWVPIPGVTPAFYLSPGDTYRFLQTFAGEERLTDDFDKTAALFRYDVLTNTARLDAKDKAGISKMRRPCSATLADSSSRPR
jgi:hypothetical protein